MYIIYLTTYITLFMKDFAHIIKPPLLNQLAFYSLLGSGAYIILLWFSHVVGGIF